MIVPEFWAEARLQQRHGGRPVTVRRFGWSDDSEQAAQQHANERAAEAMRRIIAGESPHRRDRKIPYGGADGLPIREQIVERHGDAVVTRNSYGARCLNTPNVLFADIDFAEPAASSGLKALIVGPLLLLAATIGLAHSWPLGACAAGLAFAIGLPLARWVARRQLAAAGGPEALARARMDAFVATHPDWHLRLYRTPAGFRALVMQQTFDPQQSEVEEFFDALGSDPIYRIMCRNQNCFRARLSPKPWRIGISDHLRPRPGVWPVKAEHLPRRERWIAAYEHAAQGYAACEFVTALGSNQVDPVVAALQQFHDARCGADSGRPIA